MTKKSKVKLKYLENKKSFLRSNKKAFFIIFNGLSVVKNCVIPESAPLKMNLKNKVLKMLMKKLYQDNYILIFMLRQNV